MKAFRKLQSKPLSSRRIIFAVLMPVFALVFFNTVALGQEPSCRDCHKSIVGKSFIHGPVDSDCLFCHESNGEQHPKPKVKGFTIAQKGADLCYSCHTEEHSANTKNKFVHVALSEGTCLDCHEVHSSDEAKFISTKLPELCNTCHYETEQAIAKSAVVHLPIKDKGSCANCHSAHSSNESRLLKSNEKTLCLSCHNKEIKSAKREIANISKIVEQAKTQHAPLNDGCSICHNPHASNFSSLLTMSYPAGNYAPGKESNYDLCFGCHDVEALTQEKTKFATRFRNGEKNLHFLHVNKEKGRSCRNCHSVHGSAKEHLIAETVVFGKWTMPLNYVPTENGGSCSTGCHKDWKYDRTKIQ
ncbi:MAG TPA: hypothetical protein DCG69_03360 [Bacteroidales bacterium]|nr:hypothetical protein [Bacteroidales bacterium]